MSVLQTYLLHNSNIAAAAHDPGFMYLIINTLQLCDMMLWKNGGLYIHSKKWMESEPPKIMPMLGAQPFTRQRRHVRWVVIFIAIRCIHRDLFIYGGTSQRWLTCYTSIIFIYEIASGGQSWLSWRCHYLFLASITAALFSPAYQPQQLLYVSAVGWPQEVRDTVPQTVKKKMCN